jgi:hypothetical protein
MATWKGSWLDDGTGLSQITYYEGEFVNYGNIAYITTSDVPLGSPPPPEDMVNWNMLVSGAIGTSGTNGTSGTSGIDGTSGTSGFDGTSGTSGETGTSGTSGENGTSGTSGESGTSGTSGETGVDGTSGTSGESGTSGTSGNSNWTSGTAGMHTTTKLNIINGTSGAITARVAGLPINILGDDVFPIMHFERSTNSGDAGAITAAKSRGTWLTPTGVLLADTLFGISAGGYDGTNWTIYGAQINLVAAGNWTSTSQPTQINLVTTPTGAIGSTGRATRLKVKANGSINFVPLTGDPTVGNEKGDVYFSNSLNRLRYFNGTSWTSI